MGNDKKDSFPNLPTRHWWTLRQNFVQTIPKKVDAKHLAAKLNMKEKSAQANIVPSLIRMGIIDEKYGTTEIATRWRDDKEYPAVCKLIREKVYPPELLETAAPPNPDADVVKRWFAHETGEGQAAVNRYTAVYLILCEGDPKKTLTKQKTTPSPKKQPVKKTVEKKAAIKLKTQ